MANCLLQVEAELSMVSLELQNQTVYLRQVQDTVETLATQRQSLKVQIDITEVAAAHAGTEIKNLGKRLENTTLDYDQVRYLTRRNHRFAANSIFRSAVR